MGIFAQNGQNWPFWRSNPLFGGFGPFWALPALPRGVDVKQPLARGQGGPWGSGGPRRVSGEDPPGSRIPGSRSPGPGIRAPPLRGGPWNQNGALRDPGTRRTPLPGGCFYINPSRRGPAPRRGGGTPIGVRGVSPPPSGEGRSTSGWPGRSPSRLKSNVQQHRRTRSFGQSLVVTHDSQYIPVPHSLRAAPPPARRWVSQGTPPPTPFRGVPPAGPRGPAARG